MTPPAGTLAGDYAVYPTGRAETASKVSPGGQFSTDIAVDRTGMLMAVPQDGSDSATVLGGGKGILLSPVFGDIFLSKSSTGTLFLATSASAATSTASSVVDSGVTVADGGSASASGVTIDATTTVLAALFLHPMLAHPNPSAGKQVAQWLVAKANAGWVELQAAASAFDATPDLDAASFQTAMAALLASVVATLPADLVLRSSPDLLADTPAAKLTPRMTSQGAVCISVTVEDPATPSITIDNSVGTNVDYLCVVRPTPESAFPKGDDSPAFTTPNRLGPLPSGSPIRSTFISARSYASYLDIVGNGIGLVSDLIGGATIGPNKAIPLPKDRVTEVRCLSGGFGSAADAQVSDYIAANLASDARSALVHNVTAATIEIMSAIPGADAAMKSDVGKAVLAKVIQQAVLEIEAKANSQGKQLGAGDIYEIIYNVGRAGLNEMVDKSSEEWKKGKLEKLAAFLKWGGKSLVKFINVSGKVANAGAAGTRAYALAQSQSLMEYFLVADGDIKPDAGAKVDAGATADAGARADATGAAYAWVLVETLDFENADKWATADAHASYKYSHAYSRGSYSASTTYEGDDRSRSGTLGLRAVFTGMPEIVYPDRPVSLSLSFTTTTNTVIGLSFSGTAGATFDQWDVGAGAVTGGARVFVNADGKGSFTVNVNGNPSSYNETLTATLGAGSEGSRIALRTGFSFGVAMGTNFVYEWKQLDQY